MRSVSKAVALFGMLLMVLSFFPPSVKASSQKTLVQDNSAFALDLYQRLCTSKDNIFLSPYSISTALAMTYAGARGLTEKQMEKAMHFSLSQDQLHPAFSELQETLGKIQTEGEVHLSIANSLWPDKEYPFRKEYLEAAAKAVVTEQRGVHVDPQFRADHPFVFLIQENQTGSILFLGHVIDPTKTLE